MSTAARPDPAEPGRAALPAPAAPPRSGGREPRWRVFRSLHHHGFRVVWGTFLVGQLGFWIAFISLQALMADLTDSDGSWQGVLFFTNFIPLLLFTPAAGVVADRVERRRILVAGHGAVGVTMTLLALLTFADRASPGTLLPFAFTVGVAFSFTAPASHALIANSVPAGDLASAISLQSVGTNLSRVVGPTLAAPVLSIFGAGAAFAVYAATSLFVTLRLRRLRLPTHTRDPQHHGFWSSLREGFRHSRERPPALTTLSMLAMSSLFAGAYLAFLPVVADEVFDRGTSGFTTLAAVTGFGAMLGALTTGMREDPPGLASVAALVSLFGLSVAGFALTANWLLALVLVAVVGATGFAAMTSLNTLLQHLAHDAKRGRMMSLFTVGWGGLVPVGGLWQSVVADTWGVGETLVLAGVVTAAYPPVALAARRWLGRRAPSTAAAPAWETGTRSR